MHSNKWSTLQRIDPRKSRTGLAGLHQAACEKSHWWKKGFFLSQKPQHIHINGCFQKCIGDFLFKGCGWVGTSQWVILCESLVLSFAKSHMATLRFQGCLGYKSDIDFMKVATVVKSAMSHTSLSVPWDVSRRGFIRQRGRGERPNKHSSSPLFTVNKLFTSVIIIVIILITYFYQRLTFHDRHNRFRQVAHIFLRSHRAYSKQPRLEY